MLLMSGLSAVRQRARPQSRVRGSDDSAFTHPASDSHPLREWAGTPLSAVKPRQGFP